MRFLWRTGQAEQYSFYLDSLSVIPHQRVPYFPSCLQCILSIKEDEDQQTRLAAQEKAKATMKQGIVARQVYNIQHRPRVYKNLPKGLLTVREAAERLDISHGTMRDLARCGCIASTFLVGKWDIKRRPYFFLETFIEEYKNSEYSQRKHKQGKQGALAVVGEGSPDAEALYTEPTTAHSKLTFGYSHSDLLPKEDNHTALEWDRLEKILPR